MCEIAFHFSWMLKMSIGCLLSNANCISHVLKHKVLSFSSSDTGAMPPESCVFGQLLNIAAVVGNCLKC